VTQWNGKEAPYNKAYFWDFKINGWDKFVAGFDGRFMGLMPQRLLGHPLNEENDGSYIGNADETYSTDTYSNLAHVPPTPAGDYTYAAELISRKHNLRSYIRWETENSGATAGEALQWVINYSKLPIDSGGDTNQIKGSPSNLTCIINWGIPHVDGFRLWRTPVNDSGAAIDKYTTVLPFFLVDEYLEKGVYDPTGAIEIIQIDHDSDLTLVSGDLKSTWYEDEGLLVQTQYNPFLHAFHPAPRFKRLQAYDGLLVGVTDVEEPGTLDGVTNPQERIPEAIAWSILTADEPENFPPEQQYRPDDAAEKFFALEPAGDHLFGVTNSGVYRVTRAGAEVGINRLQFRLGGVSRFGQAGVGNSLFIVTPAGVKQIDGNTGAINSISALDRIVLDDSEWASTLGDVHMAFDASVGVLILLNTSKKEAYLLWESTGAVNKLEDVPWTFLTSGPDVLTNGASRAYFVTSDAQVHVIDGARAMGKRSMCGIGAGETANGTFTSGTTSTTLNDTGAVFPVNCVGFKVHILSGNLEGESSEITVRNSGTQLTVSGFSGTPAVGDTYSVAPVVSRLILPVMWGPNGQPDPFQRKTATAFMASFSDLGGETDSDDVNSSFKFGLRQMDTDLGSVSANFNIVPDKTAASLTRASTRPFPYVEFKGGNQDWELQGVLVHGIQSMSQAQSRQGTS
jgi:hypothetical protein